MAVTEIKWHGAGTLPQLYLGLSTDTKPTDAVAGAELHEINTGLCWVYDGTNWVEDLRMIYAFIEALKEVNGG